jgi:hypothetical protein
MFKAMYPDLLVTVLASVVIGWNLGSWLIPGAWLAVLSLVAVVRNLPIDAETYGRANRNQQRAH